MCYKGKCLHCIPVENGCLTIAIISAIGTGVALLASVILGILIAGGFILASHATSSFNGYPDEDTRGIVEGSVVIAGLAAGVVVVLVGVASLVAFIFSVLLCNGIGNRRPGQVKAYFVYGVIITVLAVIASVIELATCSDQTPGLWGLVGCVIYSLFLVMVHQTYTKLCAGVVFKDHIRLVEDSPY